MPDNPAALDLSYKDLDDSGCINLFKLLCSDDGKKYRVTEIYLKGNRIGDEGWHAISEYLYGNMTLQILSLENVSLHAP